MTQKDKRKYISEIELNKNLKLTKKLISILNKHNVSNFNIATIGNSIASGYCKGNNIVPLFTRTYLYKMAKNINFYSFSRIRRNQDQNILKWYNQNFTEAKLTNLLIDDIEQKLEKYPHFWNERLKNLYKDFSSETGMKSYFDLENNIVIYSGFTGVFTSLIRSGSLKDLKNVFKDFNDSIKSAYALFSNVYAQNPNAQFYVLGLPNLSNTGILSSLDFKIEGLCKKFPNTTFVKGTYRNYFEKTKNQQELDVHYNSLEYLKLWNNILASITNNYSVNKVKLDIIDKLKKLNENTEQKSTKSQISKEKVYNLIISIIEMEKENLSSKEKDDVIDEVFKYIDKKYLEDFQNLPRTIINEKHKIFVKN